MRPNNALYLSFMAGAQEAVGSGLYLVAYHALAAALYLAHTGHDVQKILEVERLVLQSYRQIQQRLEDETEQADTFEIERLESLLHLIQNYRALHSTASNNNGANHG